ncbi:MAG: hypothetical protein R2762_11465 [Bryobacteraceae bacterium]
MQLRATRRRTWIADEARTVAAVERREKARQFLTEEEVDSGDRVERWDGCAVLATVRSRSTVLAARTLAGLPDAAEWERVKPHIHANEWREVMLPLGGVLHARP